MMRNSRRPSSTYMRVSMLMGSVVVLMSRLLLGTKIIRVGNLHLQKLCASHMMML